MSRASEVCSRRFLGRQLAYIASQEQQNPLIPSIGGDKQSNLLSRSESGYALH